MRWKKKLHFIRQSRGFHKPGRRNVYAFDQNQHKKQ